MGAKEEELREIAESPRFDVPNFGPLREYLDYMNTIIAEVIEGSDNWRGPAADTGIDLLYQYMDYFKHIGYEAHRVQAMVNAANTVIDEAAGAIGRLPSTVVPPEILNAVGTTVPFLGADIPVFGAPGIFANILMGQREDEAAKTLNRLESRLQPHQSDLNEVPRRMSEIPVPEAKNPAPERHSSDDSDDSDKFGEQYPRRTTGGSVAPGPVWTGSVPISYSGEGVHTTDPSKDSDLNPKTDPYNPKGGTPTVKLPTPSAAVGGGGGGLVPGLGGAGAAAGLAAAARMGGSGAGGLGAAGAGGARLGSGASAGAGTVGTGTGAGGAGGRGTSSVMGGGAGGGAQEKDKRSSLGGLIAPKLEDDEELGPRSAAADAGGRDGS